MHVEDARMQSGWLCLKTQPSEALRWLCKFKAGEYEIRKVRKKRSLDANAYLWVLLDRLSAELGATKEELYRMQIKQIGGVSDIVTVQNHAVEKFRKEWEARGIGWQTETFPTKSDAYTNVRVFYGSSTYDTKQMSRLIDSVVEDCKSIGIEVRPQEEIDALLREWGNA